MEPLIFPEIDLRIRVEAEKSWCFDIIRKKEILLTPEEWVRQHLVHYMVYFLHYPKSLIKVEDGLKVFGLNRRSDVMVYDRSGDVFLLAECKSAGTRLSQKYMEQISAYNQKHRAKHLVLTNGRQLFICGMNYETNNFSFLSEFPGFI